MILFDHLCWLRAPQPLLKLGLGMSSAMVLIALSLQGA